MKKMKETAALKLLPRILKDKKTNLFLQIVDVSICSLELPHFHTHIKITRHNSVRLHACFQCIQTLGNFHPHISNVALLFIGEFGKYKGNGNMVINNSINPQRQRRM